MKICKGFAVKTFFITLIVSVLCSTAIVLTLSKRPQPEMPQSLPNGFQTWHKVQKDKVHAMVVEDLNKYGADIYKMYLEIIQAQPGMPNSDFGMDRSFKKLSVTYPDSHICQLAEAHFAYGAVRSRDMIKIEAYLRKIGHTKKIFLMPSGYEIELQLRVAIYNYYFHIGKLAQAKEILDLVEKKFPDSYLFQPGGEPYKLSSFVREQKEFLEIINRKEKR